MTALVTIRPPSPPHRPNEVSHALTCLRENMAINRDLVRQVHRDNEMQIPDKLRMLKQLETERFELRNGILILETIAGR